MPITPGTRIGPYEVTAKIGEGGMGEVYQATDTNLKRAVALKVLPASVAGDPDRLARFQREAEVLAALNHPNIAQIHGLERSGGTIALVMELAEGPTLAERIARGAVPLDEAIAIARQVADALEAAHEKGIVHRDLKPANVKVGLDGTVKVLDFGLAKAMEPAGAMSVSVSMAPTITTPAMTQAGMVLGTAAYMSPEQARGKVVDKRADIWAFGCVLFEMLTGERLFKGEDVGQTLAAVIMAEPSFEAAPAHLRPLLRSCLQKDPKKRLRDIGDMALLLDRQPEASPVPQAAPSSRPVSWVWPAVAALLLATTSSFAYLSLRQPPPPAQQSLRFQIQPPGDTPAQMFTLSPDGTQLAFVAADNGPSRLWMRAMDALEARALAGTDGATYPFWSPDGQSLGFFAQGKLKKIAIAGGPPQTLCDASAGRGGTWNREGVIVFSAGPASPLLRVSSAGGEAMPITQPSGTGGHRYPAFLPDERHFLFNSGSDDPNAAGLFAGSLDGEAPIRLLPDATNALYAPAVEPGGTGFILFRRENTLMAQPFDAAGVRTAGDMFPVAEQVAQGGGNNGFGAFSVASSGALVFRIVGSSSRELWWVDRTGKRLGSATKPAGIEDPYGLSPDEKAVALRISTGAGQTDLWLQDLERSVLTRFTFRDGVANFPQWSPDGSRLVFSIQDASLYSTALYQKATTGTAGEELLIQTGINGRATDWSGDGRFLVYSQQELKTAIDLWLLPLEGDRKPVPYLQTGANEQNGRFYPDTTGPPRFMAYQSNESGGNQIYIQSIPAGAKFQVSVDGGTIPYWRHDGRELYYLSSDNRLMAVPVTVGAGVQLGTPQELFRNASMTSYVPSRDGTRFLVNLPAGGEAAGPEPITVVTNWQAGLAK